MDKFVRLMSKIVIWFGPIIGAVVLLAISFAISLKDMAPESAKAEKEFDKATLEELNGQLIASCNGQLIACLGKDA